MGYLNPVEVIVTKFVSYAKQCGVDGLLLVDLPPEESKEFGAILKQHDMDQIFLLANFN